MHEVTNQQEGVVTLVTRILTIQASCEMYGIRASSGCPLLCRGYCLDGLVDQQVRFLSDRWSYDSRSSCCRSLCEAAVLEPVPFGTVLEAWQRGRDSCDREVALACRARWDSCQGRPVFVEFFTKALCFELARSSCCTCWRHQDLMLKLV